MNIFSCRESTRLMSEAMDRELTVGEKVALGAHLAICAFCRRCEKEFALLRQVLRGFASGPNTGSVELVGEAMPVEARERVRAAIARKA